MSQMPFKKVSRHFCDSESKFCLVSLGFLFTCARQKYLGDSSVTAKKVAYIVMNIPLHYKEGDFKDFKGSKVAEGNEISGIPICDIR